MTFHGRIVLLCLAAGMAVAATQPNHSVGITNSDNQGISFTIAIDSLRRLPCPARTEYTFLSFDGSVSFEATDNPDLPARRVTIGIPQAGDVSVSASGSGEELISEIDVAPVLNWVNSQPVWNQGPAYASNGFYPAPLVRLEGIEMLRGVRVARLLITPVQFDPGRRTVRYYHEVSVQVKFSRPAQTVPLLAPARQQPAIDRLYENVLLNGSLAKTWNTTTDTGTPRNFFDRSAAWYRVRIDTNGLYKITWDDLKKAGADPSLIDPRTVQVFTVGDHTINYAPDSMIEVPIYLPGEADSTFNKQDYVAFYGQSSSHWSTRYRAFQPNLFTAYNYYWLTWGAERGRRMEAVSSPPGSGPVLHTAAVRTRREEDRLCPARSGLLWVWEELTKAENQDSISADFDLQLNQPNQIERLTLRLFSIDPNLNGVNANHVHIYLNDALLDTFVFGVQGANNPKYVTYQLDTLPGIALRDKNTVRLVLVGDSLRTIYLDYFDISYQANLSLKSGYLEFLIPGSSNATPALGNIPGSPLILDISDPAAPKMLNGFAITGDSLRFGTTGTDSAQFLAADPNRLRKPRAIVRRTPGNLKQPGLQADYFIIAPDNQYEAALLLQRYRTNNIRGIANARVQTVRLSEIYDEFSFGLEEPGAIKAFFALKRPVYGLLVGDATYDYRNNLGLNSPPGVPPYEIGYDLDPQVYRADAISVDAWYADFEGQYQTPDMIIGRITARSPDEFRRYCDKLVAYERGQFGFWNKRFLLLADDEIEGAWDVQHRDPLGAMHMPSCDRMGAMAGNNLDLVKVYLTEYPLVAVNDKPDARAALFHELEQGALLWVFFGHGAGFQLCHERAMGIDDIPNLRNGYKVPFAFFGSCGVGRWEDTKNEAVAEELARKTDGCIATVGATKATSPNSNESFCAAMLAVALAGDSTLGRAFFTASFNGDKLYHFLGEPAVALQLPIPVPGLVTTPDTLRTGRTVAFEASVPFTQGYFASSGTAARRLRRYTSIWLDTSYLLEGDEFFRGIGRVQNNLLHGSALVPNQLVGARSVSNGTYTPLAQTSRVSVLAWDATHCYTLLRDTMNLDTIVSTSTDRTGPEVVLYADGRPIHDGDYLPTSFQLSAQLTDSSGILIAPVPRFDPSMYYSINTPTTRTSVADQFVYDLGSSVTGRFTAPATLPLVDDTIYFVAADNFLNRTSVRRSVHTRIDENIQIRNALVYPNPLTGPGWFTFELNLAARVTIAVYTLSGRLVRELSNLDCPLGYNQVGWDALDGKGVALPNGVYLYRIKAQVSEASVTSRRESSNQVIDKLIIKR